MVSAAKLHLALNRAPPFSGVPEASLRGRLLIAPSLDHIEHAYNHAKYGEFRQRPSWKSPFPRSTIPALAPAGQHVLSAIVQYAPYALKEGWAARAAAVHGRGARYAGTSMRRDCAAASSRRELLTPADIEREFRISGGHWHHGDLAFDQFLMVRPVPGAAQYRTPLDGLYPVRGRLSSGRRRHGRRRPQCRAGSTQIGRDISHDGTHGAALQQAAAQDAVSRAGPRPLQVDSFIPWAGYTTVDVFTTMEQEYFAIRNATTLYDLTPMVKYRVAGPDALPYLNRLVTRDIAKLKPDRVAYCVWCNDAGHLIDDGTVFRLGETTIASARRSASSIGCSIRRIGFDVADRGGHRANCRAGHAGTHLVRGAEGVGVCADIERLKPFEIGYFALVASLTDGLAHRLYGRSGL